MFGKKKKNQEKSPVLIHHIALKKTATQWCSRPSLPLPLSVGRGVEGIFFPSVHRFLFVRIKTSTVLDLACRPGFAFGSTLHVLHLQLLVASDYRSYD